MMLEDGLQSFVLFAGCMFVMLNGPLWLSVRARVFAAGPRAPLWLHRGVSWASRLVGLAVLVYWAWLATGDMTLTLLLGLVLAIGLFCLFDGPWRIITRAGVLRHSSEAPARMESIAIWLVRLAGVVALLLGGLIIGLRATTG